MKLSSILNFNINKLKNNNIINNMLFYSQLITLIFFKINTKYIYFKYKSGRYLRLCA